MKYPYLAFQNSLLWHCQNEDWGASRCINLHSLWKFLWYLKDRDLNLIWCRTTSEVLCRIILNFDHDRFSVNKNQEIMNIYLMTAMFQPFYPSSKWQHISGLILPYDFSFTIDPYLSLILFLHWFFEFARPAHQIGLSQSRVIT